MSKNNAVVWFDIYVDNMERAISFYETILKMKLEKIIDPTGETEMMSFSADMTTYGAAGVLVKSNYAKPGEGGAMIYFGVDDCSEQELLVSSAGGLIVDQNFLSVTLGGSLYVKILKEIFLA